MARMETGGSKAMQTVTLPTLTARKSLESPPRMASGGLSGSQARRLSAPDGFTVGQRGSDASIIPPQMFSRSGPGPGGPAFHSYAVPSAGVYEYSSASGEATTEDEEERQPRDSTKERRKHREKKKEGGGGEGGEKKRRKKKKGRTDSGNIRRPAALGVHQSTGPQAAIFSMDSTRANALGLTPAHAHPMTPAQIEYLSAMEAHTRARYEEPTDTPCSVAQSRPFTGFNTPLGASTMLTPSRSLRTQEGNVMVSVSPVKPSPIQEQSSEEHSSEEEGGPPNRPALVPFNPYSKKKNSTDGSKAKSWERRGLASRGVESEGRGGRRSSAALGSLEAQALAKHHKHQDLVRGKNPVPPCSEICCEYTVFVFLWTMLYAAMIVGGAKLYSGIIDPSSAKEQGAPVLLDDFSASLQDIVSTVIVIACGVISVAAEALEMVRAGGLKISVTIITKVVDIVANVVRIVVAAAILNEDTVYIVPSMFFVSAVMETLHMAFMPAYDITKDRATNPCMCMLEGVNFLASYFLAVEQAFAELAYIIVFTFLTFAELSRLYNVEDIQQGVILQNFIFAGIGMTIIFLVVTVASDIRRRNWGRWLALGSGFFFVAVAGGLLILVFVWSQFVDLVTTIENNAKKSQIGNFVTGSDQGNPMPGTEPPPPGGR